MEYEVTVLAKQVLKVDAESPSEASLLALRAAAADAFKWKVVSAHPGRPTNVELSRTTPTP